MRGAAIDIGANSVKLVVADLDGTEASAVAEEVAITRLAEGLGRHAILAESAMERTLQVVNRFVTVAVDLGVEWCVIAGASALRKSKNGREFAARAQAGIGRPVATLSGDDEARLSALAVATDPRWRNLTAFRLLDVGGGSTEVAQIHQAAANSGRRQSLDLGAVTVTEAMLHGDPPGPAAVAAAGRDSEARLETLRSMAGSAYGPVVGVGGTVVTLAALQSGGALSHAVLHGTSLPLEAVSLWIERLAGLSNSERLRLPGMDPGREDILLAGALIVRAALRILGADSLSVCTRGLNWGLLYEKQGYRATPCPAG